MELHLYKDTLQRSEVMCSQKYEHSLETELLIPEYLPPVFKIVKTLVQPVILQKTVTGGRCQAEGYLRLTMFYQGEEDTGLCAMEQKVPFQRLLELKEGAYHSHFCTLGGEVGYLNCRAVNPRRVEVRGSYYMTLRVFGQCDQEIVTALAGDGVCQKTTSLAHTMLTGAGEKQFTLEGEAQFPTAPAAVLWTRCEGVVTEAKAISGKAVVKGEALAEIIYRGEGEEQPRAFTARLPFSQIVDADSISEDCRITAEVEVTACTVAAEDAAATLTLSCALALRHWRDGEQYLVADAFSMKCDSEVETARVWADTLADSFTNTVEARVGGTLPEENAEILLCLVLPQPPELLEGEGGLCVRGRMTAHLICRNALGELECFDKTGEYALPKRYAAEEGLFLLAGARVAEARARKDGAEAEVTVSLVVRGEVFCRKSADALTAMTLGDPLAENGSDGAIIIYYAHKGEDIFYIAKHYHADPADIAKLARLTGDTVEMDCRLLIPAAE